MPDINYRGRVGLEQHIQLLKTIKVTRADEAMKIFPLVTDLLQQLQMVLAKTARAEVLARSKASVAQRIADGKMRPVTRAVGSEVTSIEKPKETPIEQPSEVPFDDTAVSEQEASDAKAELLSEQPEVESLDGIPKVGDVETTEPIEVKPETTEPETTEPEPEPTE